MFSRRALLAGTSALALLLIAPQGANALQPGRGGSASSAALNAATSAIVNSQQAAAIAAQSRTSMLRAAQAIQAVLAAQNAAAAAARAAGTSQSLPQVNVPNGLAAGALQVAPGATPGSTLWQGADLPTQTAAGGQTNVGVNQTASKAILNWNTFNVGTQTTLTFDQHGNSGWVALNRVIGNLGPSQILGRVQSDGQVYVINQNGIIFGGSSQINVGSLVASAVGLTDAQFLAGIISQQAYTASNSAGTINAPAFSNPTGPTGDVVVQAGAVIQTKPPIAVTTGGGSVYLFGANVENDGVIITPDGQTVLAAAGQATSVTLPQGSTSIPGSTALSPGRPSAQTFTFPSDVYLTASTNPNLRGVTVLMDNGGTATNNGIIMAPTGNITMTGMTVQQSGVLAATTSVNEAGSITLFAGSGGPQYLGNGTILANAGLVIRANNSGSGYSVFAAQTGTVTLANGSLTTVLPQEDGLTAPDSQPQAQSTISIEGGAVNLLGGSTVFAPAGQVTLDASTSPASLYNYDNPGVTNAPLIPDSARVWVDTGAVIDVAGLAGVPVSAASEAIQVNVRANELRDSPLQRGGVMVSQNVWVDLNNLDVVVPGQQVYSGGGLIELSGWLGLITRSIDQRLTNGGSVTLFSTGDALLRPGSTVNISGGVLDHQAGLVPTTRLIGADGRIYDINKAPADLPYVSILNEFKVDHTRWGITETYSNPLLAGFYQGAYVEGKPAGTLTVSGIRAEVDAQVLADTVSGPFQRSAATTPAGGALIVGQQVTTGSIVIAPEVAAPDLATPTAPLPAEWQQALFLSADLLDRTKYGSITLTAGNGGTDPVTGASLPGIGVVGGATLQVAPGGSISLNTSGGISLDGKLVAHAGSVTLNTTVGPKVLTAPTPLHDIELLPRSLIDTTGLWVNDLSGGNGYTPTLYNGGNVTLQSYDNVRIDGGAVIDASSGGWLQGSGKLKTDSNGLAVGTGGKITLISDYNALTLNTNNTSSPSTVAQSYPDGVYLNGTLRSYGFAAGGQLSLATADIQIGGSAIVPNAQIGGTSFDPTQVLWLDPKFFASGGFSQYNLYSYQGTTIAAGADIELHAVNFIPNVAAFAAPTGTAVASFASLGSAPAYQRPGPVNLILSATDSFNGNLVMQPGAIINADPQATISLHARHQLTIDGTIQAPGGTINLDLTGSVGPVIGGPDGPFASATQTLWIGGDARLLAPGLVESVVGPQNNPVAIMLDGGSININQDKQPSLYYPYAADQPAPDLPLGTVVARAGAIFDVSGARGTIVETGASGFHQTLTALGVGTNGGNVAITASLGLMLDATMRAGGGSANNAGGNLLIDQTAGNYNTASVSYGDPNFLQPLFILVVSQADPLMSAGLTLGQAVPAATAGEMFIGADQIRNAGFGSASLGAVDAVVFNGSVNLGLPRSLTINARNIADGTVSPLAAGSAAIGDGQVLAPAAGAVVTLSAPYVDIGGGQRSANEYLAGLSSALAPSATATAMAGTAQLNVNANLIDIEGVLRSGATYNYTYQGSNTTPTAVALAGFQSMSFNSSGDIRLVPVTNVLLASSTLVTQGNLNFSATEIYPITSAPVANATSTSSNALFVIQASGANSVVSFASNGGTPYVPLSAGGDLQIIAPTINQGGVLLAPLGQITFGNSNTSGGTQAVNINLLPGSITSVSANGALIPYGTPNGTTGWTYGGFTLTGPPAKSISFFGQNVTVSGASGGSAAAVIDESGGGDLYGAQFISGAGGSVDTLNGSQTFAILPSLGSRYAPRDPQMQSSNPTQASAPPVNLRVGDQVYLSGIPGLAAGYYTLLPGRYALLPGGYKLTVTTPQTTIAWQPVVARPDGTYQVLGYRTVANTTIQDALPSIFTVTPGAVVRNQSQYQETTQGQFFTAQAATNGTVAPYLPSDAGRLLIDLTSANGTLVFHGLDNFTTAPGGRGGQADIVAPNLDILGAGGTAASGYVGLDASQLNAINAQSLLIGGTRSLNPTSNTLTITPTTQNVIIDQNAVLTGPEIMLTAQQAVTIASHARIDTTSSGAIPNQFPSDPITGKTLGSITVSGTSSAFVIASNAIPLPVTQTSGTSTLTIGAGADIFAANTLFLSANTINLDPTARFAAATVTVQVPVINLGNGATSGLTLTDSLLLALSQGDPSRNLPPTSNLVLNATQSINVYGSDSLGAIDPTTGLPMLGTLTLSAPAINGFGGASDSVTLAARNVTLAGATCPVTSCGPGTGQGNFVIDATQLLLAGASRFSGALAFSGFNTVTLEATGQVVGGVSYAPATVIDPGTGAALQVKGQVLPGTFTFGGNLVIASPLVTGQPGAISNLTANNGTITFAPSAITTPVTALASDGATLTVSAQTITQNTNIVLPSGVVTFTAQNGVTLGAGSETSVAGAVTPFFDVVRISPAGSITLQTANGNVVVAPGATVDVSGGALASISLPYLDVVDSDRGGNAGTFTVIAPNGTAQIAGNLLSGAVAGYTGGKAIFNLASGDAGALLGSIAGFSGEQSLTLATLTNNPANTVIVGNVATQDFELSIAAGNIEVSGTIDASAPSGTIRLNAGGSLTLDGTAVLNASATSATGVGGNVFLGIDGKSSGTLTLGNGSTINVAGAGPNGSEVWLRAPRNSSNNGVAITNNGVAINGARQLIAESVKVYDLAGGSSVAQNLTATSQAVADATNFMANTATIPGFQLLPGIEFRSSGNLQLLRNSASSAPGNPFPGTSYIYNDGIDLGGLRFNGAPAVLTLRAAGNLIINGSLSDGFSAPVVSPDGMIFAVAQPVGGRSWSLNLVAGANLAGADPMGVRPSLTPGTASFDPSGSLIFNAPYLNDQNGYPLPSVVRTGTGSLALAATGNIDIQTPFGIYTAGQPSADPVGFTDPTRSFIQSLTNGKTNSYLGYDPFTRRRYDQEGYPANLYPSYPTGGGDLTVAAHGSLIGQFIGNGPLFPQYTASQLDSFWLWTEPLAASPTWFINFGTYYQPGGQTSPVTDVPPTVAAFIGLGALGGGNVRVNVGGDLTNVDVALPTTGRLSSTGALTVTGGGNLVMNVGGAINNSNVYVGKGVGSIQAGDIGSSIDFLGNATRLDVLIGDSQVAVVAARNANVLVGDATRAAVQQDLLNYGISTSLLGIGPNSGPPGGLDGRLINYTGPASAVPAPYGFFTTFTANSAFREFAEGGNIAIDGDFTTPVTEFVAASGSIAASFGAVKFGTSGFNYLVALPAATAQVDLLAAQNITGVGVSMTAADFSGQLSNGPGPSGYDYAGTLTSPGDVFLGSQPSDLVQFNDPHRVHVYAVAGSLSKVILGTSERASIRAGLDIVQPVFDIENAARGDVSVIQAGRDITSCLPCTSTATDTFNIRVEGPEGCGPRRGGL